MTESYHYR